MTIRTISLRLCACAAGLALTILARAAEPVVIIGDDDYAPYSYVEAGHFKGMYVDILTEAGRRLAPDYAITLQPLPWKRGLLGMEAGTAFALFPPGLKAERDYIQPYSVPLYRETVVLFCNSETMQVPRKSFPDDFVGLRIGVNLGFLLSERLMQAAKQGLVKLDAVKGNDSNLKKLALNRINCYASDRTAALYSMKRLHAYFSNSSFSLQETVELSGENTYIGYSARNNPAYKADFIKKMNLVLETMRANGDIARIESNYLPASR